MFKLKNLKFIYKNKYKITTLFMSVLLALSPVIPANAALTLEEQAEQRKNLPIQPTTSADTAQNICFIRLFSRSEMCSKPTNCWHTFPPGQVS